MPKGIYNRLISKPRPTCSEETKRKIGLANKGKKISEEQKRRLSLINKGKKHSIQTRIKISEGHKGIKNYLYGKHLSIETRRKLSESHKTNGLIPPSRKGIFPSEETRKKMSLSGQWGEKNVNWKNGATLKNAQIRMSFKYSEWRRKVFNRDNFTCVVCKKIGGDLEAHHIKSFAHYPKSRFEITNGITLCKDCHKKTDNYLKRRMKKYEA